VGARVTAASTHLGMPAFPAAAREALQDTQLRNNLAHATATIRTKRLRAVAEVSNWQELREHAALVKDHTLRNLDRYLVQFEEAATAAGAVVHWAIDAGEANRIVIDLVRATGADEVVKVKSMATQEIDLNEALQDAGIAAWETDLAELIVQLGHDFPSHFLVPAIHRNRSEIREIFVREMGKVGRPAPDDLTADLVKARLEWPINGMSWTTYRNKPDAYLDEAYEVTQKRIKVAEHLMDNTEWDLMASVWVSIDRTQHALSNYVAPDHPDYLANKDTRIGRKTADIFRQVDEALGSFVSRARMICAQYSLVRLTVRGMSRSVSSSRIAAQRAFWVSHRGCTHRAGYGTARSVRGGRA